MNVPLHNAFAPDGRTQVALADLLALRARVARQRLPAEVSRAARHGQQSSRLYGRGMDYAESRAYQAGDDVRRLDWRLTARSGKLHTKLFQEDREGGVLIVLDTHASMYFGSQVRFKSVQAAHAAASIAWMAVHAGERVGMMGFGTSERSLRPRGGQRGALAICGALVEWGGLSRDGGAEPLGDALARASRMLHGANRVVVISDGCSSDPSARQRLINLGRRASIAVLVVADPLELALAPPGRYPVEHDGERRELVLHSERQRQAFQHVLGAGPARLRELARSLGLQHGLVDTTADAFDAATALWRTARPAT